MKVRGAACEVRSNPASRTPHLAPRTGGVQGGVAGGVLAVLLLVGVVAVCVWAGFWQLERLEQRRARNAQLAQALTLPALRLDAELLPQLEADPLAYLNRRVSVQGLYDPEGEIVLRGRPHQGRPGVHLVTPLRISGSDAAVLVNRGWVPSADAATVELPPLSEPGLREVQGLIQVIPSTPEDGMPLLLDTGGAHVLTLRWLDLAALRARSPYPLLPIYLQQLPDPTAPQLPVRLSMPTLDDGPHLGYALQWFSFAAIALIGFLVVVIRQPRGKGQ